MSEIKTSLGLMSGTSMDGIDLAVLSTDGEAHIVAGRDGFAAYDEATRDSVRRALDMAAGLPTAVLADMALWPDEVTTADALVTAAHRAAVQDFVRDSSDVQLIGFHGQTILHRPDEGFTLQIGDGQALAAGLRLDVVGQFRRADMAAGGQGAPLAPLYHAALLQGETHQAVLNLGGVGNITWLGEAGELLAFDTGPANALIDDWVRQKTGQAYDQDGALAARGTVDAAALAQLMDDAYFSAPPPKSLDRLSFDIGALQNASPEDGAATLTAFSAACVARGLDMCPTMPQRLILCGGGRHNKTLCEMLAKHCAIIDCDALGWRGDALEAQAFAWLAVRSVRGLALSRPETTGVRAAITGGELFRA